MAWLTGFNNRIKLTVPPDKVDSNLTDFPMMLYLSSDSGRSGYDATVVFDELSDENYKRIAVTTGDGTTQCPVEIEYWSSVERQAYLWTKVPTVYSSVDTDLYFYYDATTSGNTDYVGDTGDSSAQTVWDSNFVGVWHLEQDPSGGAEAMKESTSYQRHLTPTGSMGVGDLVDGKIHNAIDFDGTDDEFEGTDATNVGTSNVSSSAWFKTSESPDGTARYILTNRDGSTASQITLRLNPTNRYAEFMTYDGSYSSATGSTALNDGNWYHIFGVREGTQVTVYVDGVSVDSQSLTIRDVPTTEGYKIGGIGVGGDANSFQGTIDECRFYNVAVSSAWIKADYHSNIDNFVIFQDEETTTNWLTDWAKRIKLTIPSTNIDNTLTNFPLGVTVASGTNTGVIFDELVPTIVSGNVPANSVLLLQMEDGALTDGSSSNHTMTLNGVSRSDTRYKFGDYAAYWNGTLTNYLRAPASSDWNFGTDDFTIHFWINYIDYTRGGSADYLFYWDSDNYMRIYDSGLMYLKMGGSAGTAGASLNSNNVWFHIAIVRSGGTVKLYKDGVVTTRTFAVGSLDISASTLYLGGNGGGAMHGYIDEFEIINGEALWTTDFTRPTEPRTLDYYDDRSKKIAITTENGITQCPVEIERWDYADGEANLWTKVPVVHNDEDTILYLYYDVTKDDNDTYVGDTGEDVAKTVWDDNFMGVWHMSQDPSGGGAGPTNAIKDSTSNMNQGTAAGTMLTEDLVDGKIGKAIDFDGGDDEIVITDSDELDGFTPGMTLSVIIKRTSVGATENIIRKYESSGDHRSYVLSFLSGNTIQLAITKLGTSAGDSYSDFLTTNTLTDTSDFHFICGRWTSGGALEILVDTVDWTGTPTGDPRTSIHAGTANLYIAGTGNSNGIYDEVRISNIARSDAWMKAEYYSSWNTLITYGSEQQRPIFLFNGYVKVSGIPAARTVHLYRRATGELIESVVSDSGSGYFEIGSYYNDYHFVVVLPELSEGYNLIAYDQIHPGV